MKHLSLLIIVVTFCLSSQAIDFKSVQLPNDLANKKVMLRITDLAGKVVSEQWNEGTTNSTIQTSKPLESGSYILNLFSGNLTETTKLIVK